MPWGSERVLERLILGRRERELPCHPGAWMWSAPAPWTLQVRSRQTGSRVLGAPGLWPREGSPYNRSTELPGCSCTDQREHRRLDLRHGANSGSMGHARGFGFTVRQP